MSRVASLPVAACVLVCLWNPAKADEYPKWVSDISARVVQIELLTGERYHWDHIAECGVGVLISDNVILTAAHVLRPKGLGNQVTAYALRKPHQGKATTVEATLVTVATPTTLDPGPDVALLVLNDHQKIEELNGGGGVALGWLSAGQMLDEDDDLIVSYHAETCMGSDETGPEGKTLHRVAPSPPEPIDGTGTRIRLSGSAAGGYSGSPVVSLRNRSVIGVYTSASAETGEGFATPLADADVQALILQHAQRSVPRLFSASHTGEVGLAAGIWEHGADPRTDTRYGSITLEGRFYTPAEWDDGFGWLLLGARVSFDARTREQTVAEVPGLPEAVRTSTVPEPTLTIAPTMLLRWEARWFAIGADPGLEWRRITSGADRQWYFCWSPILEVMIGRGAIWRAPLSIQVAVAKTFYNGAKVDDYRFDLSGEPGVRARSLDDSSVRVQVGAVWGW
jgi:hypothetical protein